MHQLREQNADLYTCYSGSLSHDLHMIGSVERFSLAFCNALRHKGLPERWGIFVSRGNHVLVGKFVSRNHGEHAYHIVMGTDIWNFQRKKNK